MSQKVRKFINGTLSNLALGPNDPLFWLHQAFLDKIFDQWRAAAPKGATDLPVGYTALPGQNRSENMAPFLPPVENWRAMFGHASFANGYSYDTSADVVSYGLPSLVVELKYKKFIWGKNNKCLYNCILKLFVQT